MSDVLRLRGQFSSAAADMRVAVQAKKAAESQLDAARENLQRAADEFAAALLESAKSEPITEGGRVFVVGSRCYRIVPGCDPCRIVEIDLIQVG